MKAPLTIATVLKPQGIRGEIKVRALTDSAENLKAFKTLFSNGNFLKSLTVYHDFRAVYVYVLNHPVGGGKRNFFAVL